MTVLTNGGSLDTFMRERLEEAIASADNAVERGVVVVRDWRDPCE
jgi:hypothetical protein